jgi:hypothetical protein
VRPFLSASIAAFSACGVTPAAPSARAAPVPCSSVSASSSRSTVTNASPAFTAICSAWSNRRAISGDMYTWPAPAPSTLGSLASSAATPASARFGSPPAAAIRFAHRPSRSSSRTFKRCSGVRR